MKYYYYDTQTKRSYKLNTNGQRIDKFLNDTVNPYEYTIQKSDKVYLIHEISTRDLVYIIHRGALKL